MDTPIDGSVYPDEPTPEAFHSLHEKADYVHRVVSAFDFGLPPDAETLRLFSGWKEVFDAFPLASSPGCHALRSYFRWPLVAKAPFTTLPTYLKQDAFEGRSDGFEDCVGGGGLDLIVAA